MKSVIVNSPQYWNSILKFRRHHLSAQFDKNGYQVLFFNPVFSILSFFVQSEVRGCFFDFFKKPKTISPNLQIFTFPPLFPFQEKLMFVKIINWKICKLLLKYYYSKFIRSKAIIQILYQPTDLFRIMDNSFVIYECIDEHSEYPWNSHIKNRLVEQEKELMKKVDFVTFTSKELIKNKKGYCKESLFLPNGVDLSVFKLTTTSFDRIKKMRKPVLLYIGAIMEWFDIDLINKIADYNKEWNIVLIGPMRGTSTSVHKNIIHLGTIPQTDLRFYISQAEVCLIPFLVNGLTKGVNPLKIYEYLACGKPVVSSPLPDVVDLEKPDVVEIGYSHDDFIMKIEKLLNNKSDISQLCISLAKEYSWETIFCKLENRLNK